MKLLKISIFVLIISLFNWVIAIGSPTNVVLDKSLENWLEISWDAASGSVIYALSYWKESAFTWSYENELEIIVEWETKALLQDLESNTIYYIAVKSYDSLSNESEYSKEVSFSTTWQIAELKISNIDVLSAKQLNLSFNTNLNTDDSLVWVNIVNLDDSLQNVEVVKYEIKDNVLKIFLLNDLNNLQNYSATVISLEWINWEKIKSWVDWIINFEVPESFEINITEVIELNSAPSNETKVLGWEDVETPDDVETTDEKAIEIIAKEKETLPTTGPVETLLFLLLSLIIWALFLVSRNKTNS